MKTIKQDPQFYKDSIEKSFKDFISDVSDGIIKIKENIWWLMTHRKSDSENTLKFLENALDIMREEARERYRREKAYLQYLKIDDYFYTLKELTDFSVKYNLEISQVQLIIDRLRSSGLYGESCLNRINSEDISAILNWDIKSLGRLPNLATLDLQGYTSISKVGSIARQVNCTAADVTGMLQKLKMHSFLKEDVLCLVKEDYLAIFELLGTKQLYDKSPVSIYNQMSVVLRRCINAWGEKVFVSAYARPGDSVASIGEQLIYFIDLSSEEIPQKCNYALKCMNLVFLSYGVKLPDPQMTYLAAIWAVMASCMTGHANFCIAELGAAIIAVIISLLNTLIKEELEDTSLLLSTDQVSDWSDISSKNQRYLNDDIKDMIDSWRNTLSILTDRALDLSKASRMLSTYSFGTSYIRYMCSSLSIHALLDSISPYPTKYSLHNLIKLYRSDKVFEDRVLKLQNQYDGSELQRLKLAYLPYDKKGKRGDFCSHTSAGYVRYYNSMLSDALKVEIKEQVTSNLPHNAPICSGEVVMGLLDAEDIFAEETKRSEFSVSVKNDKQIELYARLAAHVYGKFAYAKPYDCEVLEERWTDNDMHSIVYKRGYNDIICAFAGTDSLMDWVNNFAQAAGLSPQYDDALRFGREVCKKYPGKNIVFVGHSQGGGEAAYCAAAYGKSAYTFNPAGLSSSTLSNWGLSSTVANYKIHSYVFRYDVLNVFQDILDQIAVLDIFADGIRYNVKDYIPEKISFGELHGMKGILRYFGVKENQNSSHSNKLPYNKTNNPTNQFHRHDSSKQIVTLKKLLLEEIYHYDRKLYIRGRVVGSPISEGDKLYIHGKNGESYTCYIDKIMKNGFCCNSASKGETVSIMTQKVITDKKNDAICNVLNLLSQKK